MIDQLDAELDVFWRLLSYQKWSVLDGLKQHHRPRPSTRALGCIVTCHLIQSPAGNCHVNGDSNTYSLPIYWVPSWAYTDLIHSLLLSQYKDVRSSPTNTQLATGSTVPGTLSKGTPQMSFLGRSHCWECWCHLWACPQDYSEDPLSCQFLPRQPSFWNHTTWSI